MKKQYVMANIKIPVEICSDNTIIPLTDNIEINITDYIELPEKMVTTPSQEYILNQINNVVKMNIKSIIPNIENPTIVIRKSLPDNIIEQKEEEPSTSGDSIENIHEKTLSISFDELQNTKKQKPYNRKNISFKNNHHSTSRYSMKNRSNAI